MDRYLQSGGAGLAPAAPAASAGYPTGGNPGGGVPASKPGEWWFHMITEELRAVITAAGLTPDHANLGQVAQAVALLSPSVAPGAVVAFARNTAPTGWLKANGAAVSRTTYAALFAAIGTTFGVGDGSTTFNLPDLRGEFVRGWDDGRTIDNGRVFGTSQLDAFQGHGHNSYGTDGAGAGAGLQFAVNATAPRGATLEAITLGSYGTPRVASETRPRNVALLFCIKF